MAIYCIAENVGDYHLEIKLCIDLIDILFIHTVVCCQLLLGFVVCRGHNNNNNNNNNISRATTNISVNMNSEFIKSLNLCGLYVMN